ncbi:hypothetical protein BUALT_Bualt19G0055800 [Buddleja alternifolia]|uniref:F-box domain-containing protein n=1 Tax=Buddleja alternifolia TaxID=168488 RepID=A0AAV6W2D3_9LAMI|nr:hypothetical protein BUALT_Bualt19G0055800 [Buddleja alternifolia]
MENVDYKAPDVPEEIIIEILLRLPVESLLKFRCVSKLWCFLISSHQFAKAHINFSTKNNIYAHDRLVFGSRLYPMDLYSCFLHSAFEDTLYTGYIYPETDENLHVDRVWIDYPLYESDDLIWLVGSCNGLICVSLSVSTLILWNPITRKSKVLPESGTDLNFFDYCGITYGFGFDELHDDYKVVEFFSFDRHLGELEIQVKVYSLRTNSWKILSNWPGGDTFGGSGKFLNGAIHWSVTHIDEWGWAIITHDLATDTFTELPLPDIDDDDVRVEIKVLGGCLSVCCEHSTYMDVWVMKEYGVKSSWTKVVRIPFYVDLEENEFVRPSPLFLMRDGKILINYGSNLRIYDPGNPHIHLFGKRFQVEAITYFESLVSPNLDD